MKRRNRRFRRWFREFSSLDLPFDPNSFRKAALRRYFNWGYSPLETIQFWGLSDA